MHSENILTPSLTDCMSEVDIPNEPNLVVLIGPKPLLFAVFIVKLPDDWGLALLLCCDTNLSVSKSLKRPPAIVLGVTGVCYF